MATNVIYGNYKKLPSIDRTIEVKKPLPSTGENLLLMSRAEFFAWLDQNNRTAKPISQLIEEYEREFHEDNRPAFQK